MKITAYFKHAAIAALALIICVACSTDENFYYQDTPRVRLVGPETWAVGTDSILFSFVTYPQETKEGKNNILEDVDYINIYNSKRLENN